MAELINLNRARKSKTKSDKAAVAAQNRVKFGLSKAEKLKLSAEKTIAQKLIDAHNATVRSLAHRLARARLTSLSPKLAIAPASSDQSYPMSILSDFSATRLLGGQEALADYAGKVVLVVNVASSCGFTPQYAGLEQLWQDYRDRGLVVLGFPCNQFGNQEAGSDLEIATFCSTTYNVTFPMFSKVEVNGPGTHPLFQWLKKAGPGLLGFNDVKWNFTKFLIDRDGQTVKRYGSDVQPQAIAADIEKVL